MFLLGFFFLNSSRNKQCDAASSFTQLQLFYLPNAVNVKPRACSSHIKVVVSRGTATESMSNQKSLSFTSFIANFVTAGRYKLTVIQFSHLHIKCPISTSTICGKNTAAGWNLTLPPVGVCRRAGDDVGRGRGSATDLPLFCREDLRREGVEPSINLGALQGQLCLFMQFVRLSSQIDSLTRNRPPPSEPPD